MESAKKRLVIRKRKKLKIRKRIFGTAECPRVSVSRTTKHVYMQAIDDEKAVTLASLSTLNNDVKEKLDGYSGNINAASFVGKMFGEKLMEKGLKKIVFDRNGFLYHGRVKSMADGIREAGLKF